MKRLIPTLFFAFCLTAALTSCDNGRNCKCTTTFSGTGSSGMVDQVVVHEPFDKTTNPDCSVYEGTEDDGNGLISTTTCVVD